MSFANYVKIKEASEKDVESIFNRELHFNNIFGNKLRIVVPLESDQYLKKIIDELEELEYQVDYQDLINKKTVYKKIKTQQGEKLRPEKVGKALQNNNFYELLDWWQKNGDKLKNNEVGSSIVISRSPIDLLRMSDHDGISSCHSPDGSYYHCAVQEAKTGGAVAYVVKNSDLKKVNLQDQEIFEDPDRKIKGIVPLERLRLRRLSNNNFDLLIPELRTYGIKNVGFLDTIKSWAKSAQNEIIKKINPLEDYKSFKLRGGSYQDTSADRVWNNFFNTAVTGGKTSQDEEDEKENEEEDLIERAERQLQEHQQHWKRIFVNLDYYDGYLSYSASSGFSISENLLSVNLEDKNTMSLVKRAIEDNLDISGLNYLEIQQDSTNPVYNVTFSFDDSTVWGGDYNNNQLVRFEQFLDYVDEVDNNFNNYINKLYKNLIEKGYIKNISDKVEFKNFDFELEDDEFQIISKEPEKVGYLRDFLIHKNQITGTSKVYLGGGSSKKWDQEFIHYINSYKVLPINIKYGDLNLYLLGNQTQGLNLDITEKKDHRKITGWMFFELNISIDLNLYKNSDVIKRIKNLDNNWNFYVNKLSKLFDIFIKNQISDISNVQKNLVKNLSKKPQFKKPTKQLALNFKDWVENLSYEKMFSQRDISQKENIGKLLGFSKKLNFYKQGSFATLYYYPKNKNILIKVTSHKEDVYNLLKAQKLNSNNVIKLYEWANKEKFKYLPSINSFAILVEKINGNSMVYTTSDFYELSLGGKFNLAGDWIIQGGNIKQKIILKKYNKENEDEYNKLYDLFQTLYKLRKFYKIDLSDFEDNIIDTNNKYVIIDMGY